MENTQKTIVSGDVKLTGLNNTAILSYNGENGIFIPFNQNPSLWVGTSQQTGAPIVSMNIVVRECRNAKTESSHIIKLSVGKANRQKFNMTSEAVNSLPIIGNLITRTYDNSQQQAGGQYQGQAQGQPRVAQPLPQQMGFGAQRGGYPAPQQPVPQQPQQPRQDPYLGVPAQKPGFGQQDDFAQAMGAAGNGGFGAGW